MSRINTNDDELAIKHPLADINEIVISPDDVADCIQRNHKQSNRGTYVLRVTPPFRGSVEANLFFSEPETRYADNIDPVPIHIDPFAFLCGHADGLDSHAYYHNVHSAAKYPNCLEDKDIYERDADDDTTWDEWRETTIEIWRNEARACVKEVTTITFPPMEVGPNRVAGTAVPITIQYDE
ncbi:hypothetical protein [Halorubrum sp. SD626R]|uniref:hypothetical protein n=1 Tax=Halorubrum sp. SD626R TaxID=1419722 RepID=UPI000AC0BCE2|nr:hypothetical protein [Halorubrum sp. SD626R]TKX79914.1 hypothetical protein EXE53_13505 [Halorubrum sp. SD626R]